MAYVDTLKVYEILRGGFEEKQAEKIAHGIEAALKTHDEDLMKAVATKGDIAALRVDMANVRADLIRWMFIFWIGQFASIVGVMTAILFAFFKK